MEVRDACLGDAVLTPELVSLRAVLSVAIGNDVSATFAANNEHLPHLVIGQLVLVLLDFLVTDVEDHVTVFTVIDCFEDCFVAIVDPVLSHRYCSFP